MATTVVKRDWMEAFNDGDGLNETEKVVEYLMELGFTDFEIDVWGIHNYMILRMKRDGITYEFLVKSFPLKLYLP